MKIFIKTISSLIIIFSITFCSLYAQDSRISEFLRGIVKDFGTGKYSTRVNTTDSNVNNPYLNKIEQLKNLVRCNKGELPGFGQEDCASLNKKTDEKLSFLDSQCLNTKNGQKFKKIFSIPREAERMKNDPGHDYKSVSRIFAKDELSNSEKFKFYNTQESEKKKFLDMHSKIFNLIPFQFFNNLDSLTLESTHRPGAGSYVGRKDSGQNMSSIYLKLNYIDISDEILLQVLTHELGHAISLDPNDSVFSTKPEYWKDCFSQKLPTLENGCAKKESIIARYADYVCGDSGTRRSPGLVSNYKSTGAINKEHDCIVDIKEIFAESFRVWTLWCYLNEAEKQQIYRSDIASKILVLEFFPELVDFKKEYLRNISRSSSINLSK